MANKTTSILLLLFATLAGMSLWFMTAAILPDLARVSGADEASLAALSSAVQAGFVAGALAISLTGLADRLDPRRLFAACAFGTAVANLGLLVVPVGGPGALALRFATGALMAGVYPVGMKIAVGWGLRDRGFLVGLVVGALTAGKSIPYLLAWLGGADWRLALSAGSAFAATGGLLVLLAGLGPHHARTSGFRVTALVLAWTDRRIRGAYLGYLGHMWELFAFWAWVGAAATASFIAAGTVSDPVALGKLTAFAAIVAGAPACLVAGLLSDRLGKARIAAGILFLSGSVALLSAATFGGPVWVTLGLFTLWGFLVVPDSAQYSAMVADHAPPEFAGSLLTFQTALGFLLTVLTVQVAPQIAAGFGWPALLALLAIGPVFGLAGLAPLLRGDRITRRAPDRRPPVRQGDPDHRH